MTAVLDPVLPPEALPEEVPVPLRPKPTGADRSFRALLAASAALVLALLAAILAFLLTHSWWAFKTFNYHFFIGTDWAPDGTPAKAGVLALLVGSVAIAAIAIAIALPVSLACSLMINEYSPVWLRRWLIGLVDLLATVPSIVYGFWGLEVLSNATNGPAKWLATHVGFVPILRTTSTSGTYGKSVFVCGIILAVMIIPVVTSVSREVMSQAPRDTYEAALALGGTRWGAMTDVVLPFSRSGIVGGAMLGIGRALGETMAVLIILSSGPITFKLLGPGNDTVAKAIADGYPYPSSHVESMVTLAGLTLFAVTLLITTMARVVVKRSGGPAR